MTTLVALTLAMLAPGAEPVSLQWKLAKGDVFYVKTAHRMKQTVTTNGKDEDGDIQQTSYLKYKVLSAGEKGYTLEQTIQKTELKSNLSVANEIKEKYSDTVLIFTLDVNFALTKVEGLGSCVKLFYRLLGPNPEAPFGQGRGSDQSLRDRAELGLGQSDPAFVGGGDLADQGVDRPPGHRAGPMENPLDRVQQRPVPVLFQNAPAAFDGVVFAVVRRQIHQFDLDLVAIGEPDQTVHELGPGTADLRAVVEFDVQPLDTGMNGLPLLPPALEAVGDEVAGLLRVPEKEQGLVDLLRPAVQFENSERNQKGVGRHVVIERPDRSGSAGFAASGEVADFDLGLGVDGDPQGVGVGRCPGAGFADVFEDRVGLGDFFSGRVLSTRRRR